MNKRIKSISIIILLVMLVIPAVYAVSSYTDGKDNSNKPLKAINVDSQKPFADPQKAISYDNTSISKKQSKNVIDISDVTISTEIEDRIKKLDAKNSDKNIKNYKKLIKELNVPEQYRNEIEKLIKKGKNLPDILISYNFLYENYGSVGDLAKLIEQKNSGQGWADVFSEYSKENQEFVPTNFKQGYLEELMKDNNISTDDVMIADMLSQKGLEKFEDFISSRKQGKTWEGIKTGLGIVNISDKLPRIAVNSAEVKKYKGSTGLNDDTIINAIVIADKLGVDEESIIGKVKSKKDKSNIYAEALEEKYK